MSLSSRYNTVHSDSTSLFLTLSLLTLHISNALCSSTQRRLSINFAQQIRRHSPRRSPISCPKLRSIPYHPFEVVFVSLSSTTPLSQISFCFSLHFIRDSISCFTQQINVVLKYQRPSYSLMNIQSPATTDPQYSIISRDTQLKKCSSPPPLQCRCLTFLFHSFLHRRLSITPETPISRTFHHLTK